MHRLLSCVALATLVVQPVAAQSVLYATSGSQRRVDAYRVQGDGLPGAEPFHQRTVGGPRPRRLLARGCRLYVGERDRVEVYRIRAGGSLEPIGATRRDNRSQLHDFEIAPDGRTLYVPIRRENVIAAYPLDEDGKPSADLITENDLPAGGPTSCIFGPGGADWEDLEVANGKLYVATSGRINAYGIDETGALFGAARIDRDRNDNGTIEEGEEDLCPPYSVTPSGRVETCIDPEIRPRPDRPDETCPFSFRNRLNGGVGLVVRDRTVVVGERIFHHLTGFQLDEAGNFPSIPLTFGNPPRDPFAEPTKKEKRRERRMRKKNRTDETIRYIGLTFHQPAEENPVIYGAGYSGRIDAFRLQDDGTLPKLPGGSTPKDVTSTPVRTAIGTNAQGRPILYVAAGERDRIQVFPLFSGGLIDPDRDPVETAELSGSFPNDVVLTDITGCD
jgi:hypothetical protein